MPITALDGLVILVTLLSALLAMVRGFSREVLSLASWGLAALIAYLLYEKLLPSVTKYISNELMAKVITFAVIFLVALLIISIFTMKLADLIIDSRIGALDRTLGFVFGVIRGLLILAVAVLFLNHLNVSDRTPSIADAKTKPMLDSLGNRIYDLLPEKLLEKFMKPLHKKDKNAETIPEVDDGAEVVD